jgi:hypothetical protein
MFATIRKISAALHALVSAVEGVSELLAAALERMDAAGGLVARMDELERTRALWEARMEAEALKVDVARKATLAGEQRARKHMERAEQLSAELEAGNQDGSAGDEEELPELPEEYRALLRAGDGAAGPAEAVPTLFPGMGRRREGRDSARAMKWGKR